MLNIDIDTGGTMTDGLVSGAGEVFSVKVETTPHDVTIAFMDVLQAAARRLGHDSLRDLLDRVGLIRWSSTITSNVLAQRSGPKLGLLVSSGHEQDLYGAAGEANAVIGTLISAGDISGIRADAADDEVRSAVKALFDKGIRRINISLAGAFEDNSAERKVVSMIDAQYPDHFLGSIPALAASEILLRPDDMTRTFVSLVNAYVHPSLATTLYRAEETVKATHGWRGNILVGHINGGVARIGKTTAFDTIESGPLFGTHATAQHAAAGGHDTVLAIDVGGTTTKVSVVAGGRVAERDEGDLFGIPLRTNLPLLRSIALGGGSVARVADGALTLGPDSMGAAPGPACYGLGGSNATLTDAFVVLGYLSPTSFLDGRRVLDVDAAAAAIDRTVAQPLAVPTDEAARRIVAAAYDQVARLATDAAAELGWRTEQAVVYAFGGNGPLFATEVADRLGASTVRLFGLGHVLSAYGSAISDVVHVYESAVRGRDEAAAAFDRMHDEAQRDLRGEGFDPQQASYLREARDSSGAWRPADQDADPTLVRLTASFALPSVQLPTMSGAAQPARGERAGIASYDWSALPAATVDGPALVDGGSFTWLVSEGWSMRVDDHGDATLSKGAGR